MSQYGTLEDCLQTIEHAQFGEEVRKAIVEAIRFAAESGGGGGGGSITFDNAMSDTSENAVQNKVIYRSISNMVGRNQNLVNGEIINAAGTNVITSSGKVIGGNYFADTDSQNEGRVATEKGVKNYVASKEDTSNKVDDLEDFDPTLTVFDAYPSVNAVLAYTGFYFYTKDDIDKMITEVENGSY